MTSYGAFLLCSEDAKSATIEKWDMACVTAAKTNTEIESIYATLQMSRSGSDAEIVILGRILELTTEVDDLRELYKLIANKVTITESRAGNFGKERDLNRLKKLQALAGQVFQKWNSACMTFINQADPITREFIEDMSRRCPQVGDAYDFCVNARTQLAIEEERLAKEEKEKRKGSEGDATVAV